MRRVALLLLLAGSAVGAAPPGELEGVLCVASVAADGAESPCEVVRRGRVAVIATDAPRRFVWTRGDGEEVVAGIAAAGSAVVDLRPGADAARLVVALDPQRWPAEVAVAVKGDDGVRRWTLPNVGAAFALRLVGFPPGEYALEIAAERHRTVSQSVSIGGKPRDLGRIVLRSHPLIRGRVVHSATGEGSLGAAVELPTGRVAALVDRADGAFEIPIEDEWPDSLVIRSSGYATRVVPVPPIEADTTLPTIELTAGVRLRVSLRAPPDSEELSAELFAVQDGPGRRRLLESRRVRSDTTEITFEALARGDYLLVVRGDEPLQHHGSKVQVGESEGDAVDVHIEPIAFALSVTAKRAAGKQAAVTLRNSRGMWDASVVTDEEGQYRGELWQGGEFTAVLELGGPSIFARETVRGRSAHWEIKVPEHRVTGRVSHARSKRPVASATVFLKTDLAESTTLLRTATDAEGRFEFPFAEAGRQTLTVDAPGFIPERLSFLLQASEAERDLRVSLRGAVRKAVRAVFATGAAAAGAQIVVEDDKISLPVLTDASGRAEVAVPETGVVRFWIIPKEGSFATATVSGDARSSETVVTIPPGEASLRVRAEDEEGNGIAGVHVQMRHNGRVIPPGALRDIAESQGQKLVTGADGTIVLAHFPLGVYELWPYFRRNVPPAGVPTENAPARIAVQPGTNTVTLTFARR